MALRKVSIASSNEALRLGLFSDGVQAWGSDVLAQSWLRFRNAHNVQECAKRDCHLQAVLWNGVGVLPGLSNKLHPFAPKAGG